MARKDAPYLPPKERRAHAVAGTVELLSGDIDILAVRRELCTPYPRAEVADATFLRAQKAISALLRTLIDCRDALDLEGGNDDLVARVRALLGRSLSADELSRIEQTGKDCDK